MILAIDPGPERSGWVEYGELDRPYPQRYVLAGTDDNATVLLQAAAADVLVYEWVECYGMPVGADVFETVFWCGRFAESTRARGGTYRVTRREVKLHLCGTSRAKDANVRRALLDKFGGDAAARKGGVLYGVKGHAWAALAVAVTFAETRR